MHRLQPERAVLWTAFDGRRYDSGSAQYRTTNLGRAMSAPDYLVVGNGTTATTFPTDLPRGMYFDGGDYLRMTPEPALTRSTPFTVASLVYGNITLAFNMLMATLDVAAVPLLGWMFGSIGASRMNLSIFDSNNANLQVTSASAAIMGNNKRSLNFFAATYDGSSLNTGINMYANGSWWAASSRIGGPLTGSIVSGRGLGVGTRWSGAAVSVPLTNANLFHSTLWPYALSLSELRYLEHLSRYRAKAP